MTPRERVFSRLAGNPVDRIPNLNIVMTFAAKYIGVNYSKYATDYRILVDGNLAVCEKFGIDMLSAISDPCRETADLGAKVLFPEDGVPQCKDFLIKEYTDIKKLSIRNPLESPRMLDRIKAVDLYHSQAAGQYPILGWVEGAFAQANDLRGMTDLMTDIYMEPAFVRELLDFCIEQEIAFAREQIKAGADFIGIGDAAASLVGPAAYKDLALPYEKRLVEVIHSMGAKARLHICGNTGKLLDLMPLSGADIIDVDWMVDFGQAVEAFGNQSACGNFDPVSVALQGNAGSIREAVRGCISRASNNTFIAAGCEIPRDTPYENMAAISEAIEEAAQ